MNCNHIDDLCSARFDGDLKDDERVAFDTHVAACASCRENWASFQSAVGMLRNVTPRETSKELHAATLAAVDGASAAGERPNEHRARPLLLATFGGAAAAMLVMWFVFGLETVARNDQQTTAIVMNQEIVSLQRGETHTSGGIEVTRSETGELSVQALPVAPEVVERIVKVPVERRVEVPVEVRVEVPVEVPVEVRVEVPVEVFRGPLVSIDTAPLAAALRSAGQGIGAGIQALANTNRVNRSEQRPPRRAPSLAQADPEPTPTANNRAALRVLRTDGRLTLETSGSIDELVPALLAQLTTPDAELQTLIERQLAAIHEQAAADPAISDDLTAMPDRIGEPVDDTASLFGRTREAEPEAPAVAWATWWRANGDLITQASL